MFIRFVQPEHSPEKDSVRQKEVNQLKWKTRYLANLIRLIESDDATGNEEFLMLLEIEKRIRSTVDDYVEGAITAMKSGEPKSHDDIILNRRNLKDLFVMALVDSKISELEEKVIEKFIDKLSISKQTVESIKKKAMSDVEDIFQSALRDLRVQ
jgi:hypothetical protein